MELSLFDVAVFVVPALLVAGGVLYGMLRARRRARRARRLTCLDAIEPAGIKLEPDTYCEYALRMLPESDAFAYPVIVGNRFLGFFSRADAARCDERDLASTYVGTIMTTAAYCGFVLASARLENARRQLRASPHGMLPVLDKNDRLLGFITEESVKRVAARALAGV